MSLRATAHLDMHPFDCGHEGGSGSINERLPHARCSVCDWQHYSAGMCRVHEQTISRKIVVASNGQIWFHSKYTASSGLLKGWGQIALPNVARAGRDEAVPGALKLDGLTLLPGLARTDIGA